MGIVNYGTQIITFDYKQEGTAKGFDAYNYKILPDGIYNGFSLTKVDDSTVTVGTGSCAIEDSSQNVIANIRTTTTQNVTISSATPYIIFRFRWVNIENNYMDMLAVAYSGILSGDLVIGRGIYNGTILSSIFDYSLKSYASLQKVKDANNNFRVLPTEPISNLVYVDPGTAIINGNYIDFAGGYTSAITITTTDPRIDLIYIDANGSIQIREGTAAPSPTIPEYPLIGMVVAEIHRLGSRSDINGTEIVQINPERHNANISSSDTQDSNTDYNLLTENGNYRNRNVTHSPNSLDDPFFVTVNNFDNGKEILQEAKKIGIVYPTGLLPFFRTTPLGPPNNLTIGSAGSGISGTFYYVVCSKSNNGVSTVSSEQNITVTNKTINLGWDTVNEAIGYRIFRGTTTGVYSKYQDVSGESTITFNDNGNGWNNTPPNPPATDETADTAYILKQYDRIIITVTDFDSNVYTSTYNKTDADTVFTATTFKTLLDTQFSALLTYIRFQVDTGFSTKVKIYQQYAYNIQTIQFQLYDWDTPSTYTLIVNETYSYSENNIPYSEYYRIRGQDLSWTDWKSKYSNNFEFLNSYCIENKNSSATFSYNVDSTINTITIKDTDTNFTLCLMTYSYNVDSTINYITIDFYMFNSVLETYRLTYTYDISNNVTAITSVKQ